MQRIVDKALEKGRQLRYQSAAELRADMQLSAPPDKIAEVRAAALVYGATSELLIRKT